MRLSTKNANKAIRRVRRILAKEKTKLDFPQSKETKQLLTTFRKYIEKNYGRRCKTRGQMCHGCEMWAIYDLVEVFTL